MAMNERTMSLLEKRALDVETCAMLGFDTAQGRRKVEDDRGTISWENVECLAIPFYREGQLIYRKLRTLEGDKFMQRDRKGVPSMLWNEDCLRDETLIGETLIITEGELDAVAAIECGYRKVTSVPDGAPNPGEHRDDIPLHERPKYKFWEATAPLVKPEACPVVIIAADGDLPGAQLLQDLSQLIGRSRCKYVVYPKLPEPDGVRTRCKDLNEVKQHYGVKGVQATLDRAEWIKVPGVVLMSELPPIVEPKRHELPFPGVGKHYHLRFGDFAVLTGVPSYGKSTVANDLYCRFADKHGLRIAWASFEQNPQIDHKRNLRRWFMQKPVWEATPPELAAADEWIDRHNHFIVPDEDDEVTLDWMLEKMAVAAVRYGCKIIILDPWNEMDHVRYRDETLTEYVGRAIRQMKRFARKYNVHFVVIAHPSKMQRAKDTGMYPKPTLYDISDSANWYNKADIGMVVHREADDFGVIRTTLTFAKSRYHDHIGPTGEVEIVFFPDTGRFDYIKHVGDSTVGLQQKSA